MLSKYRLDYKRNRYATAIIDISGATLLHYKKNELLKNIKKILVIRLDHIGDVIVSVPALRALRKSYPNASITIMVRSLTKELLENCPYVDEVLVYDPLWYRGKKTFSLSKHIKFFKNIRKRNFDLAIDLRGELRNIVVAYLCNSRYRLAYDVKGGDFLLTHVGRYDDKLHIIDRNLNLLKTIGINSKDRKLELFTTNKEKKFIDNLLKKNKIKNFVILHPGSGGLLKLYDNKKFAKIGDYLSKKYNVILTGSNNESWMTEEIKNNMNSNVLDLTGELDLLQLTELIKRAKLFVSTDSGPMHIAKAVNTKLISLFGTSLSNVWGYKDKNSILIENKGNVKLININQVIVAIKKHGLFR
ncbi:MAG: glycosyltransferase family 9 protein [Candidatus Nanoarchaeia archaeon]|jgi:predicted lipopolysaccharide heptosyltransferase III|nr:glycosyltransferase family 9 protein [Candidatus Nanoarchaeia archaeon]|tara:strand:+ start:34391 stop:35464 length:1074 start_codon:yes stop_codon:yes gene_type:complete